VSRATARRRAVFLLRHASLVALAVLATATAARSAAFTFEDVVKIAEARSHEAFQRPAQIPEFLREISYDQWRDIRYRPDAAVWRDRALPFQVQFFHPGLYYDHTIKMYVVDADGSRPIEFSPSKFDYGRNEFASQVPQDLGPAGFRLHYPIKTKSYWDEVIVFLGASYFRAVGRDQGFGLSARALAIDTAVQTGEEFPYFDTFWLVRPTKDAKSMTIYALLESASVSGAYKFVVHPGKETAVDVEARLFFRKSVQKLGIAPLTSMFYSGEGNPAQKLDYRPEVHDSDGLLVSLANGEWLWRPLGNPERLHVSSLRADGLAGFGLLQRDRDFDHYQDLETRQDIRPSAWIIPKAGPVWEKGHVELVEIPTDEEINDNIVTYWVPDGLPKEQKPLELAYRILWYGEEDRARSPNGRAIDTRRDHGHDENTHRFVVEFDGEKLRKLPADAVLRGVVTVGDGGQGELLEDQVVKNVVTGGWRLVFEVRPSGSEPIELRAYLDQGGSALTETWSYVLEP